MGKRISNKYLEEEILKKEAETMEEIPAGVESTGDPKTRTGIVVDAAYVNVRREASFESEVLEVFRKGDRAVIIGEIGEFYKIRTSVNPVAYISSAFFKEG